MSSVTKMFNKCLIYQLFPWSVITILLNQCLTNHLAPSSVKNMFNECLINQLAPSSVMNIKLNKCLTNHLAINSAYIKPITFPQALQWCRLFHMVNFTWQIMHINASLSGIQYGASCPKLICAMVPGGALEISMPSASNLMSVDSCSGPSAASLCPAKEGDAELSVSIK